MLFSVAKLKKIVLSFILDVLLPLYTSTTLLPWLCVQPKSRLWNKCSKAECSPWIWLCFLYFLGHSNGLFLSPPPNQDPHQHHHHPQLTGANQPTSLHPLVTQPRHSSALLCTALILQVREKSLSSTRVLTATPDIPISPTLGSPAPSLSSHPIVCALRKMPALPHSPLCPTSSELTAPFSQRHFSSLNPPASPHMPFGYFPLRKVMSGSSPCGNSWCRGLYTPFPPALSCCCSDLGTSFGFPVLLCSSC